MRGRTNVIARPTAIVNGEIKEFIVADGENIEIGDFVSYFSLNESIGYNFGEILDWGLLQVKKYEEGKYLFIHNNILYLIDCTIGFNVLGYSKNLCYSYEIMKNKKICVLCENKFVILNIEENVFVIDDEIEIEDNDFIYPVSNLIKYCGFIWNDEVCFARISLKNISPYTLTIKMIKFDYSLSNIEVKEFDSLSDIIYSDTFYPLGFYNDCLYVLLETGSSSYCNNYIQGIRLFDDGNVESVIFKKTNWYNNERKKGLYHLYQFYDRFLFLFTYDLEQTYEGQDVTLCIINLDTNELVQRYLIYDLLKTQYDIYYSTISITEVVKDRFYIHRSGTYNLGKKYGECFVEFRFDSGVVSKINEFTFFYDNRIISSFPIFLHNNNVMNLVSYNLEDGEEKLRRYYDFNGEVICGTVDEERVKKYDGSKSLGFAKTGGMSGEVIQVYIPKEVS